MKKTKQASSAAYAAFLEKAENPNAIYACINYGEAFCPEEIRERSICIDADIGDILLML